MSERIEELAHSWSRIFSSLSIIPDFVQRTNTGINTLNGIHPPKSIKELINLHQRLTEDMISTSSREHQLTNGDFQTNYIIARRLILHMISDMEEPSSSVMDPTCGTGVFLLATLTEVKFQALKSLTLVGIDRNRQSLSIAWLCLTIAKDLLSLTNVNLILMHEDLLNLVELKRDNPSFKCDLVLGNPPWITWSDLKRSDREKWQKMTISDKFQFVRAKKMQKAMGSANTDIGPHLMMIALNYYTHRKAKFGFLFKAQSLNSPALYHFRAGVIPHIKRRNVTLTQIIHLTSKLKIPNFLQNDIDSMFVIGSMDTPPSSQIKELELHSLTELKTQNLLERVSIVNEEILYLPNSVEFPFRSELDPIPEIRHGIKHDCKEVFEINIEIAEQLNWECVYPIIKSRHISKTQGWNGEFDLIIIPNISLASGDIVSLEENSPLVYRYLYQFKDRLLMRNSRWLKSGQFYSIFGVGPYSFAPYKVAWVRLGWKPIFSIIKPVVLPNGVMKPVILSDHFLFIPTQSLEYASKVEKTLNSKEYQEALAVMSTKKKSSLPKKLVSRLKIPVEGEI